MDISINEVIIPLLINEFGGYWYIFITYMIFNLLDWITGLFKAIKSKKLSSHMGINGLIKKLGYWIIIGIAFSFSTMFVIIGKESIGINLSFMYLMGWFTFFILMINEAISILENLVALNIVVPRLLIKSLKRAKNILGNASEKLLDNTEKTLDYKKDKKNIKK